MNPVNVFALQAAEAKKKTAEWFVNPKPYPAAACPVCGGWSSFGGCSHLAHVVVPTSGRVGCVCHKS